MANNYSSVSAQTGAMLKRFYADAIVDNLNEDMPLYKAAEKIKKAGSGEAVYAPVRLRRNQGIGAGPDGGNLPSIGRDSVQQAKIDWKFQWLRTGLTAGLISASKNDKGSFVREVDYRIRMGYKDFANDFNRQLAWSGNGALASLSAAAVASTTITVYGREGVSEDGNKFLDVGQIVDIYTTAGVAKATGVTINAISGVAIATLTLDTPVTAAADDILVRTGSYGYEVEGLLYSMGNTQTTTINAIDRSLYPQFQSNVLNLAGGQLTLDSMQDAYNEGLRRGGTANGSYRMLYMDFDSLRFYQKLCTADKRYVNTMQLDAGAWKNSKPLLEFNGVACVADKDAPNRIFFVANEILQFHILEEMTIADEWGSNMLPALDNDAYEIRFRMFGNAFNSQPSAMAVIRNYISP